MTMSHVNADEAVAASTMNHVIDHTSQVNGRAIFTANGTWNVPTGVFKFKVTLCGGGGKGGDAYYGGYEGSQLLPGPKGGDGPLCSKVIGGQAEGAAFTVTIGAGSISSAPGGTTSFGALLQSTGGQWGSGTAADGTHTGEIRHHGDMFMIAQAQYYGMGGTDTAAGKNGICVIEW